MCGQLDACSGKANITEVRNGALSQRFKALRHEAHKWSSFAWFWRDFELRIMRFVLRRNLKDLPYCEANNRG